ncbi:MAG: hypothetical protein ABIG89_05850, partial [Candidatus Woesearchaeota archaeon]
MKKVLTLLIISAFILSLATFAFAADRPAVKAIKADLKEDIKDAREDLRDAAQLDMERCLERCRTEGGSNCIARCRAA